MVGRMENGITKLSNLDAMTIQPEKKSKYNITVDVQSAPGDIHGDTLPDINQNWTSYLDSKVITI